MTNDENEFNDYWGTESGLSERSENSPRDRPNEEFNDSFGTDLKDISFAEAATEQEIEHAIGKRFNDVCTEAIEEGVDPMVVAQELHDLSEGLKITLYTSSLRTQYNDDMENTARNDYESKTDWIDDDDHPLK